MVGQDMSLAKAKDYIDHLHKRQANPYLWPDFLTGLPDKTAILHRLDRVYPRLGKWAVAYVRTANVNPFLLKYGTQKHAEIIQWAAAILKTTAMDHGRSNFVGVVNMHDFVVMAPTGQISNILKNASALYWRRTKTLYSREDIGKGRILAFQTDRTQVSIGFIQFIHVIADTNTGIPRSQFLPALQALCSQIETEGLETTRLGGSHKDDETASRTRLSKARR